MVKFLRRHAATALLLVGAVGCGDNNLSTASPSLERTPSAQAGYNPVMSRDDVGPTWPFSSAQALVACDKTVEPPALTVEVGGRLLALNPEATSLGLDEAGTAVTGGPDAGHPGLQPLRERARALCDYGVSGDDEVPE